MPLSNTATQPSIIAYRPQIDGLRFCAVLVVLIYHYLPMMRPADVQADISILLAFFFVLSSYLITKILMVGKDRTQTHALTRSDVGIAFLIRRTLRIFPAYYCYLMVLMLLPDFGEDIKQNPVQYFSYTANFLMYSTQNFGDVTGHLWTLSVEEQFYLIWPWIILFTPARHLRKVFGLLLVAGIGSRILMYLLDAPAGAVTSNVLTPTCLDSFALGALLALDHKEGKSYLKRYRVLLALLVPVWLIALYFQNGLLNVILQRFLVSIAALLIINGANKGYKGFWGRFLSCKPVLYLAGISYGIYLYHVLAVFAFWKLTERVGATLHSRMGWDLDQIYGFFGSAFVSVTGYLVLSILMAMASWYLVERPLNSLKKYFTYARKKETQPKKVVLAEVSTPAS